MENMIINSNRVKKLLNQKADKLSNLDFMYKELAQRVMSRLEYLKLNPLRILECGSGLGFDRELLEQRYPDAMLIELDIALNLLRAQQPKNSFLAKFFKRQNPRQLVCANARALPIANGSINFCYANLLLPYLGDPQLFIKEMRRVLALGGAFCFSGLGVDSLKEIRSLGLSSYTFPDMHDIGDMLIAAGFSNPVVDSEYITLEYEQLGTLLDDVRLVGCGSAKPGASQQKYLGQKFIENLQKSANQPIKLTLEIFVAHGWKDQNKIDLPTGYSPVNFSSRALTHNL